MKPDAEPEVKPEPVLEAPRVPEDPKDEPLLPKAELELPKPLEEVPVDAPNEVPLLVLLPANPVVEPLLDPKVVPRLAVPVVSLFPLKEAPDEAPKEDPEVLLLES